MALALLSSSCSDGPVAGTSSGWDNPSARVAFVKAPGRPQKVSGELQIFAANQNPAIDPNPLARIRIKDTSSINLMPQDFERVLAAGDTGATTLMPTLSANQNGPSSQLRFTLVFAGDSSTGAVAMGLLYASGKVTGTGVTQARLEMLPQPLVRYEGRVALDAVHGELGRVYVPGTAYQATLDNGHFVFTDLPPTLLPINVLSDAGYIFPVAESLDTRADTPYEVALVPADSLPVLPVPQGTKLHLTPGADREAHVGDVNVLEASLVNEDSSDARLSILWRQIDGQDTANVKIGNPTRLSTSVTFLAEGAYRFQVNVTLLKTTVRDTVRFTVRSVTMPVGLRLVQPKPGDSLVAGKEHDIFWEMPSVAPVTLLYSPDGGVSWDTLAQHFSGKGGSTVFPWTPATNSPATNTGLLEVRSESDTTSSRTKGTFSVVKILPVSSPKTLPPTSH